MNVSVIYVNWNAAEEIAASIDSIRTHVRDLDYEIIVVDNNSAESCAPLEQDGVTLIRNPVNAGFGAGCNLGVQHSTGRYLLFLNPDTRVHTDMLSCLAHVLDTTPRAGACGPMVIRGDGSIDYGAARADLSIINEFLEHSTLPFAFRATEFLVVPTILSGITTPPVLLIRFLVPVCCFGGKFLSVLAGLMKTFFSMQKKLIFAAEPEQQGTTSTTCTPARCCIKASTAQRSFLAECTQWSFNTWSA